MGFLVVFLTGALVVLVIRRPVAVNMPPATIKTTGDNSPVYLDQAGESLIKPARLSDSEIAAIEDALAYLVVAGDAHDANMPDAAQRAVEMAALVLQRRRAGEYRPNTPVSELISTRKNGNGPLQNYHTETEHQ